MWKSYTMMLETTNDRLLYYCKIKEKLRDAWLICATFLFHFAIFDYL